MKYLQEFKRQEKEFLEAIKFCEEKVDKFEEEKRIQGDKRFRKGVDAVVDFQRDVLKEFPELKNEVKTVRELRLEGYEKRYGVKK